MQISTPAAQSRSPTTPIPNKLLEHARTTADIDKRVDDYCAISRLVNKEAIWFWTFQNTYYAISSVKLKGFPKMYNGVMDVSGVWLE
jgi:4-phytase/acid phosphatase/peptide/nickel transport system substrate-binding protein